MSPKDWVLLVIALSPDRALQPLQLQKALYLIGKKLSPKALQSGRFYKFEAHDYGTFALDAHSDTEKMVAAGLLWISQELWPSRQYLITPKGQDKADILISRLDSEITSYVKRSLEWITSLTLDKLRRKDVASYPSIKLARNRSQRERLAIAIVAHLSDTVSVSWMLTLTSAATRLS
ncbi:MAG TPA: hypothetical protein VK642_01990 [Burkholderiales bacterium]|nr:hypothetical protein [Burkholderiales bacterium]